MIEVTSTAAVKIKDIMKEQGEEEAALRIVIVGMGCGGPQYMLTLDKDKTEDDTVIESSGVRLFVDPDTASIAEGARIDYVEDLMKSGFVISNPNAQGGGSGCGGGCSCGKQ